MKRLKRNYQNDNDSQVIKYNVIIASFFLLLSFFFPYTGDDWAWGSNIGIERLMTWFDNYNGRYAGNVLVLLLTRSKLLNVVSMATCYWASCWLCCVYSGHKSSTSLIISCILFLIMPKNMFRQVVAWTAGFSNYVPSALITTLYICYVNNVFENNMPHYAKWSSFLWLVLGFVGGLFIENLTIINILLAIFIIIFANVKFGKAFAPHVTFLIGSIIGCICMFSNSAYSSILNGSDGYRSTASTKTEFVENVVSNLMQICQNLFVSNWLFISLISVLLLAMAIYSVKEEKTSSKMIVFVSMLHLISVLVILMRNWVGISSLSGWMMDYLNSKKGLVFTSLIYAGTLVILVFLCVDKLNQLKLVFPALCIPFMVAPLLVVNPIGPRCFFCAYLMMMLFTVALCNYLFDRATHSTALTTIKAFLCTTLLFLMVLYVGIFEPIYQFDKIRNNFSKSQAKNGDTQIVISRFINNSYLWCAEPNQEPWSTRYKLFYGLSQDLTFEYVDYDEYLDYISSYSK